jgi:alpha-tubulin suppressor-like RCC1 family protein
LDGNLHIWNIGPRGYFRKRQEITISEPIKQIVSFTANIAILTTTGNVYSWVYDYYSNKYERAIINLSGHGETGKIFQSPKKIEGLDNIVQISMGNIFNMLAVDSSGDLYLWGKIIPGIADNYKERNKLRRVIYEAKKLFILAGNTSGRASYLDLTKALQINKEDDNVNDEDDNNFSSSSPLKIRFNPDIRVRSAVMSGGKILILGKDGQLYTW